MEAVAIISLVLSAIVLIVVVVLLIVVFKKKPVVAESQQIDLKEIGSLSKQIELLSKQIKGDIELALAKEITTLYETSGKQSEANNEKLERFQKNKEVKL